MYQSRQSRTSCPTTSLTPPPYPPQIFIVDRHFEKAALTSFVASVLSVTGLIHSSEIQLLVQKDSLGWRFALAYGISALFFLVLWVGQRVDLVPAKFEELDSNEPHYSILGTRAPLYLIRHTT